MKIIPYEKKYKNQVIALILYIQNYDNKVDLSLGEQPDMNDIENYYFKDGGCFWIAINDEDDVVGTLGFMNKYNNCGVLKKFFVMNEYRGKEYGIANKMFEKLVEKAKECGVNKVVLDTPSACYAAHAFYKKHGFSEIGKEELPITYDYPDRDSDLFLFKV